MAKGMMEDHSALLEVFHSRDSNLTEASMRRRSMKTVMALDPVLHPKAENN